MRTQWMRVVVTMAVLAVTVGCATTRHSEGIRHAGFLSDYNRLEDTGPGGSHHWSNPEFQLSDYDAVCVPQVELRLSKTNQDDLQPQNANRLATLFRTSAMDKLKEKGWIIAAEPGERTFTIRLALTELNPANPYANVVTGLPTYINTATLVLGVTTDVHLFVGKVSTEVQVIDSEDGTILAEALDRRVGSQSPLNMGSTWGDVEDVIDIWTDRLAAGFTRDREHK